MGNEVKMPLRCVIDCDPGCDDVLALLLALSSPELLILSIITTHGNTDLGHCTANARKTLAAVARHVRLHPAQREKWPGLDGELRRSYGLGPIQLIQGAERPIEGEPVTAKYFHGRDGLSDIASRHPELSETDPDLGSYLVDCPPCDDGAAGSAPMYVRQILRTLGDHPRSTVAYLVLGPLTTLAQVHRHSLMAGQSTRTTSALHELPLILHMGGAVDCPGNTLPDSEFNVCADPFAAQEIFALELASFHLFPLDITSEHTLPFEMYGSLVDSAFDALCAGESAASTAREEQGGPVAPVTHFTTAFMTRVRAVMRSLGDDQVELHDPAVAWALVAWARARTYAQVQEPTTSSSSSNGVATTATNWEAPQQQGTTAQEEEEFAPGWLYTRRVFEVETTGTITRGMLVVDRRQSASSSNTTGGGEAKPLSRAKQFDRFGGLHEMANMQNDGHATTTTTTRKGVKVITATPGQDTLRGLMLERIWNVRVPFA